MEGKGQTMVFDMHGEGGRGWMGKTDVHGFGSECMGEVKGGEDRGVKVIPWV